MSYNVETMPLADEDLQKLPRPISNIILRRFLAFARNPGNGESRPAPSTYPPGQLLELAFPVDDMFCFAGIVFKYGADEQTLVIERIFVEFQ
ncbi:MAG TPA: hypothetical protein VG269_03655 [Tepidisphaeraceae bacterium]|jgi:hypothetical protein|nr:hypothetical protein [Tepidisphaeraceae bacterium]